MSTAVPRASRRPDPGPGDGERDAFWARVGRRLRRPAPRRLRRALLAVLAAAIVLSGLNLGDVLLDRSFGNSTRVEPMPYPGLGIGEPDRMAREHFARTHAVVGLGGFGQSDATDALHFTAPALQEYGRLWDVRYNPKGIDIPDLGEAVAGALLADVPEEERVYVTFLGVSAGGKVSVLLADYLLRHHGDRIVPRSIIAVSSPYEGSSTVGADKKAMARASGWAERTRFQIGPVGRTLLQYAYQVGQEGDWDLEAAWERAAPKPYDLQLSQLRVVADPFPVERLRRLREETGLEVAYVRALDPGADTTVNVRLAALEWGTAYGPGKGFRVWRAPVDHARLYLHPDETSQVLAAAMSAMTRVSIDQTLVPFEPKQRRAGGDPGEPVPDRRVPAARDAV